MQLRYGEVFQWSPKSLTVFWPPFHVWKYSKSVTRFRCKCPNSNINVNLYPFSFQAVLTLLWLRHTATINACHIDMNEQIGLFFLDFSSWPFHQILIYSVFQFLHKILRNHVQKMCGRLQFWVCSQIWCSLYWPKWPNLGQIRPNFWSGRANL